MEKLSPESEINIPVPWGLIAGKTWGEPHHLPVLLVHGIQDNVGSFERLIPLLPKCFYYVCIDLPGHGKSTHFENGVLLQFIMFVVAVKHVINYFKWEKMYYIGHSFGGQIGLYLTSIFSGIILKLVIIDAMPPVLCQIPETLTNMRKLLHKHIEFIDKLQKSKPPSYTHDEFIKRMIETRGTNLLPEHAKILAERALIKTDTGGYRFSNDQQLKLIPFPFLCLEQTKILLSGIQCPTLIIFATDTLHKIKALEDERITNIYFNIKNARFFSVTGNHDVHLSFPERVASVITDFLLEQRSHL